MKNYHFGAPKKFWETFPVNKDRDGRGPYVLDSDQILERARKAGVQNMQVVHQVVHNIREGCDLKVKSTYDPRISSNAPSARSEGQRVTDALGVWIKKKIVAGPFEKHELPEGVTISGLMCRLKPTGQARIIVNQSSPKHVSMNHNIDKKAYPCSMGGTKEWIRALNFCGPGALIAKGSLISYTIKVALVLTCHSVLQWIGMTHTNISLLENKTWSTTTLSGWRNILLSCV